MLFFSIHTVGCKLNQLESEAVADAFRREGFPVVPWEGPAPGRCRLLVINTCTVTSMAEQKARRLIRKALREDSGALVLTTGCYAQLNRAELETLGAEFSGRLLVIPGRKKSALLDLPRFLGSRLADSPGAEPAALIRDWLLDGVGGAAGDAADGPFRFVPEDFSSHSRAFLKIQDGCDRHCTYCRVRLARGKSVSLPPEEVLRRLRALEARGCAEAVLTGVNICRYGTGPDSGVMGLGPLLDCLLEGTSRIRLRLSSLEPEDIDERLLESFKNRRLRPHFHLSIQSGSGRVLEKMGRASDPGQAARVVSRLREMRGDPFIACDIITGFPGEEEEDFLETLEFCGRMDFAWIHGFPYSPRPGTAAWALGPPRREAGSRAARLLGLARQGRRNYARRWMGKELELVLEGRGAPGGPGSPCPRPTGGVSPDPGGGGLPVSWGGTSENYLKILIPPSWLPKGLGPGGILRCRVREIPGPRELSGFQELSALRGFGGREGGGFDALGDPRL
jgi:threonylcarbamoyladenosine tRNA methylthiotransferase MtaB